jgi:hypothetical protein
VPGQPHAPCGGRSRPCTTGHDHTGSMSRVVCRVGVSLSFRAGLPHFSVWGTITSCGGWREIFFGRTTE